MASRIAALQAKLGGGGIIMGGMRPGATNPLLKKKKQVKEPKELDNSAILNRATRQRSQTKRKNKQFDELISDNNTDNPQFDQTMQYQTDEEKEDSVENMYTKLENAQSKSLIESETKLQKEVVNDNENKKKEEVMNDEDNKEKEEVVNDDDNKKKEVMNDDDNKENEEVVNDEDNKEKEEVVNDDDNKKKEVMNDDENKENKEIVNDDDNKKKEVINDDDNKENKEVVNDDDNKEKEEVVNDDDNKEYHENNDDNKENKEVVNDDDNKEKEEVMNDEDNKEYHENNDDEADRWDYDIKNLSQDERDDHDEETASKISVSIDSKLNQYSSLVDILMDGPQTIINGGKELIEEEKESVETMYTTLENAESKSLLKKYLSRTIFDTLKGLRTTLGCDLKSCIRSGIDNLDSGIGVYASDSDAYSVFSDLLNPIIEDYHKLISLNGFLHPKQNFAFDDTVTDNLDTDGNFIISTRIRVARNIDGYPLRGGMNQQQTMELEHKVKDILNGFEDEDLKGMYYPLNGMDEKTRQQLVDDHFLFKKGDRFLESAGINNFWPNGRGIFFNNNKTFLVWVNEEDHLRIISMEKGANIKSVFGRLQKAVKAINDKLSFAYNEQLGYLTACPTNIGCGERASVHLKVPLTSQNKQLFQDIAKRHNLQIRGVHGEHSESKDGVYDVSNKRRLGITEWDGVKDLINGCKELIESETKLQKERADENEKKEKAKGKKDKAKKKKKGDKATKTTKTTKTTKKRSTATDKNVSPKKKKTGKNTKKKEKTDKSKATNTKNSKKKKRDLTEKGSKSNNKSKKKSKEKGNDIDLRDWMKDNNVYDKQLYTTLVSNNVDSLQKLKKINEAKFDNIVRKFRVDRFAKIRDKKKRNKIDKILVLFEKSWKEMIKTKKSKKKAKKQKK